MNGEVVLRAEHIMKEFPGVKALDDVRLELRSGEVHALCGENGAGKSTLLKVITGIYAKDGGEIYLDGEKVEIVKLQQAKNGYKQNDKSRQRGRQAEVEALEDVAKFGRIARTLIFQWFTDLS